MDKVKKRKAIEIENDVGKEEEEVLKELELPSDSVPSAHDKTQVDIEHDIVAIVENARQCAVDGNLFKSGVLLKRACKLTAEIHGPLHLDLAAHLSKLAAIQEVMGQDIDAKMTWERALYIFEVNRAKVEDKKERKKRRRKRKDAKALSIADGVADKVESSPLPPIVHRGRGIRKMIDLEQLFRTPHQSMTYADGTILYTKEILPEDLTPRTRRARAMRGCQSKPLRIRDFHSFYAENPNTSLQDRRIMFVKWAQRREKLHKELAEDHEVLQLEIESHERLEGMEKKLAEMAAALKAKRFGLDKVKGAGDIGANTSILPTHWKAKYKGSVAAAIDASKFRHIFASAGQVRSAH